MIVFRLVKTAAEVATAQGRVQQGLQFGNNDMAELVHIIMSIPVGCFEIKGSVIAISSLSQEKK